MTQCLSKVMLSGRDGFLPNRHFAAKYTGRLQLPPRDQRCGIFIEEDSGLQRKRHSMDMRSIFATYPAQPAFLATGGVTLTLSHMAAPEADKLPGRNIFCHLAPSVYRQTVGLCASRRPPSQLFRFSR